MQIAGVAALTLPPWLLLALSEKTEPKQKLVECSLFKDGARAKGQDMERICYMDNEGKFREAFSQSDGGKGQVKTAQVPNVLLCVRVK